MSLSHPLVPQESFLKRTYFSSLCIAGAILQIAPKESFPTRVLLEKDLFQAVGKTRSSSLGLISAV